MMHLPAAVMATSFQPEHPHESSKASLGWTSILVTALIAALVVLMLFALAVPQFGWTDGVNWGVTIGAALLTFVLFTGIGMLRGRQGTGTEKPQTP